MRSADNPMLAKYHHEIARRKVIMLIPSALMCLALNVYHEARGEPEIGQAAVAMVTLNRAQSQAKVCDTVAEKNQFSWTAKFVQGRDKKGFFVLTPAGQPKDEEAWYRAKVVAINALRTFKYKSGDVTQGATMFHAKNVQPYWTKFSEKTATIGSHVFYKVKDKSRVTGKA